MPKISVIVPLYNEERFIADTIYCLRAQTFDNFECIIIDDCSTDNSINVALNAIDGDSRFLLVKNKINSKLPAARNIGLLYSSGEYVIFLDSDDILSNTCLEERYNTANKAKSRYVAGSYSMHCSIFEETRKYPESKKVDIATKDFINSFGENPFVVHSPCTRRDIAVGVGGFNESLINGAEDYDFWMKILRHGFIFLPTKTLNAFYRSKNNSMVRSKAHLHLLSALSIFQRSSKKLTNNDFYSISFINMCNTWYEYANETRLFNRIMRFLGMQICNKTDINYEYFAKFLPSIHNKFPLNLPHYEVICAGIRRADSSVPDDCLPENYRLRALYCISELISTSKKQNTEEKTEYSIYSPAWQRNIDIVFIPHKDYHAITIYYMKEYLDQLGLTYVIVDSSAIYRDEGVRTVLQRLNIPNVSLPQLCFGDFSPKCIITFNDWDKIVARPAIEAAKKAGIVALAIVEGVQDYDDVDTGRVRNAYKSCTHVITPCSFDMKYFDQKKQHVYEGGIPRIDKLASESEIHPYSSKFPIVINSNFSYNVLVDKRDEWVRTAVEACIELNLPYVISRHPADIGDFSTYKVTSKTMYDAIWNCSLFISRFGSGIIEAIAMGRPIIYYNPHHEKVDKFKDSLGAYYIAYSKEELKYFIKETYKNIDSLKKNWPTFLAMHAGYNKNVPFSATHKVIDAISAALSSIPTLHQEQRKKFSYYLSSSFQRDDSIIFKNCKPLKTWKGSISK